MSHGRFAVCDCLRPPVRTGSVSGSLSGDGYGSVSSAGEEDDLSGASFKVKCSLCGQRFSFEEIADHSAVCDATYTPAARRGRGKSGSLAQPCESTCCDHDDAHPLICWDDRLRLWLCALHVRLLLLCALSPPNTPPRP